MEYHDLEWLCFKNFLKFYLQKNLNRRWLCHQIETVEIYSFVRYLQRCQGAFSLHSVSVWSQTMTSEFKLLLPTSLASRIHFYFFGHPSIINAAWKGHHVLQLKEHGIKSPTSLTHRMTSLVQNSIPPRSEGGLRHTSHQTMSSSQPYGWPTSLPLLLLGEKTLVPCN